jgi:hypothetical protein
VVTLFLGTTGIVVGSITIANAVRAAQDAPFCLAAANDTELLGPDGPQSLYKPMYADADGVNDPDKAAYFNAHVDQIQNWHDEWVSLAAVAPSGDSGLNSDLASEEPTLDTSTGVNGTDGEKDWSFVGLYVENVNEWVTSNCH